jgi:cytochrome P450
MVRAMSHVTSMGVATPRRAKTVPLYRTIRGLMRDPLKAFEDIGRRSQGEIVRLNLGLFRPYLVTNPDHVQHVLRDRADNYVREGTLWEPLRRLVGNGLAGEGTTWEPSRRLVQPLFAAKTVASFIDEMAKVIGRGVEDFDQYARTGQALDVYAEMSRIINLVAVRAFFGDRISAQDAGQLSKAIATAFTSIGARMLAPFAPDWVTMPGDRAFWRAVQRVDEIMAPLVREASSQLHGNSGILSLLSSARDENGNRLTERQIRDDLVAIIVGGSEASAVALTWFWVVVASHPQVAARLQAEIDHVIGTEPPSLAHLPDLRYTKMILQEVLRLYPPAWIIPRTVLKRDIVDGLQVNGGATVLVSPYLTHRVEEVWERPQVFDPERFSPDRNNARHRFSYLTFGGGATSASGATS